MSSCLLFKRASRICHIQPATAITYRQTITEHMLTKLYCHLRVERLHEAIAKNVARNYVRMARTENQIAVGINPRPIKGHEATLVSKRVQIIGKVGLIILAA